jgi:hypothetical protein
MMMQRLASGDRTTLRGVACVAMAALLLGGVTACGGGSSSSAAGTVPTPSRSVTTAHQAATHPGPRAGQCHLSSTRALDGTSFDRSKPVPCAQQHNVETASVHAVYGTSGVPDQATLQGYYGDCGPDVGTYLRMAQAHVSRIGLLPVPAQNGSGKTVVRCDLVVLGGIGSGFAHGPFASTRGSLRDQAAQGDLASWHLCSKHLTPSFPLVACTAPHPVEALFHTITLHLTNDRYPSGGTDNDPRGDALCRHAVAPRPDAAGLTVHSHWLSRADWESQQRPPTLDGVCWFWRTDGKDLPPTR